MTIRKILATAFASALISLPAYAAGDSADFAKIQWECVNTSQITVGPDAQWKSCKVLNGRYIATHDENLADFYYADYCLGDGKDACAKKAMVVFSNRAYTPKAHVVHQRIDPAGTTYDHPMMMLADGVTLIKVTTHVNGVSSDSYLKWAKDSFVAFDSKSWVADVAKKLPEGTKIKNGATFDGDTMTAKLPLTAKDKDAGVAEVELGVNKDRFTVANVRIAK